MRQSLNIRFLTFFHVDVKHLRSKKIQKDVGVSDVLISTERKVLYAHGRICGVLRYYIK